MANSKDDDYENVSLDSHVVAANDKDDDYENISLDSGSDIDNVIEKKDEEECIDISAILQIQKWWHIHYAWKIKVQIEKEDNLHVDDNEHNTREDDEQKSLLLGHDTNDNGIKSFIE